MKKSTEQTADRLTDEALSRKLGGYQRAESIGMLLGIPCAIAGCILAVVKHDVVLFAILFFAGVGLILLVSLPAQKKKRALLHQQLGDFFRTELDRAFGPAPEAPELPIDKAYLESAELLVLPWTDCAVSSFREGVYRGMRFSAANVELSRTVEERSGPNNDNWMTRTETIFHGVIIRCRDLCDPAVDMVVSDWMQKRTAGDQAEAETFRQRFSVRLDGPQGSEAVTPELREMIRDFEKVGAGRLCGLSAHGGAVTAALETQYVFADIPDALDMRDVDGMRRWFTATLDGMGKLLDILIDSPGLSVRAGK